MAIIKNKTATLNWLNEQHRNGNRTIIVSCDGFDGEVYSLNVPLTIRQLEEGLGMYGQDDVIRRRVFWLLSRAEGLPAVLARLNLDVDLTKHPEPEEDFDLDPLNPNLFDWQIWTSKLSDGVILRFSDDASDYSFDMGREDLERLHERIGDFLKVGPEKAVKPKASKAKTKTAKMVAEGPASKGI